MRELRFTGLMMFGLLGTMVASALTVQAQGIVVPGTGSVVQKVGDDFEDPDWKYRYRLPKSTHNLDERMNAPGGVALNGRWYEGVKRGQPDIVRRVETPAGGLPGSTGSLLLQSRNTGVPGKPSYKLQQDDFICAVHNRLGGSVRVSQSPSAVVRVFLPPVAKWESRNGPHFAFRVALETVAKKKSSGFFASSKKEPEIYWPGLFIEKMRHRDGNDYAYFRVRSNRRGGDYKAKQITTTGWWTLGLSCTPDGRVHYFAKPGIEDLTKEDRIASEYPYGYRALRMKTFFFNVCSADDGRRWSTPWVIDDPTLYFVPTR